MVVAGCGSIDYLGSIHLAVYCLEGKIAKGKLAKNFRTKMELSKPCSKVH